MPRGLGPQFLKGLLVGSIIAEVHGHGLDAGGGRTSSGPSRHLPTVLDQPGGDGRTDPGGGPGNQGASWNRGIVEGQDTEDSSNLAWR